MAEDYLRHLNRYNLPDREKGLVPFFRRDLSRPGFLISTRPLPEPRGPQNPWLGYQRAVEAVLKYRNYDLAKALMEDLGSDKDTPESLPLPMLRDLVDRGLHRRDRPTASRSGSGSMRGYDLLFRQHRFGSVNVKDIGESSEGDASAPGAGRQGLDLEFATDLQQNLMTPLEDYWVLRTREVSTAAEELELAAELLESPQLPAKIFDFLISRMDLRYPTLPSARLLEHVGSGPHPERPNFLHIFQLHLFHILFKIYSLHL